MRFDKQFCKETNLWRRKKDCALPLTDILARFTFRWRVNTNLAWLEHQRPSEWPHFVPWNLKRSDFTRTGWERVASSLAFLSSRIPSKTVHKHIWVRYARTWLGWDMYAHDLGLFVCLASTTSSSESLEGGVILTLTSLSSARIRAKTPDKETFSKTSLWRRENKSQLPLDCYSQSVHISFTRRDKKITWLVQPMIMWSICAETKVFFLFPQQKHAQVFTASFFFNVVIGTSSDTHKSNDQLCEGDTSSKVWLSFIDLGSHMSFTRRTRSAISDTQKREIPAVWRRDYFQSVAVFCRFGVTHVIYEKNKFSERKDTPPSLASPPVPHSSLSKHTKCCCWFFHFCQIDGRHCCLHWCGLPHFTWHIFTRVYPLKC